MNIVCTIDDAYAQHCGVMLCSLFRNNPGVVFRVFLLTDGLSATSRDQLGAVAAAAGQTVEVHTIDSTALAGARVSAHVSVATYFRILIPARLPPEVDKVLFLDSDLIVRGSVTELYDTPVDEYSHAAVENPFCRDDVKRLGMPEGTPYFNAGVLLLNLRRWRNDRLANRVLAYVNANTENLLWWDQDALNATLYGQWRRLAPKWNAQGGFFTHTAAELGVSEDEWLEARANPRIVHYTGSGKPWSFDDGHPLEGDYFKYLAMTPWKGYRRPAGPSLRSRLIRSVRSLLGSSS